MVDACTFCVCTLRCTLTRTHLTPTTRSSCEWYVPLEKTYRRSLYVQSHDQTARTSPSTFPFLPSSQFQRADPGCLFRGRRQWKQGFLIFGNRILLPVTRQHICPIRNSLPPGRKAVCISEAGYMADHFCCQHPKMTKPTKIKSGRISLRKPPAQWAFWPRPPVALR